MSAAKSRRGDDEPPSYLARLRAERGLSQRELGRLVGVTAMQVGRWERGRQNIPDPRKLQLAEALQISASDLVSGADATLRRTVPLVGYVGAGAVYYADPEAGQWGRIDDVEAPPGGPSGVVAVQVRGDSMYPVYRKGDLLYFVRGETPIEDCIGRDCIVEVAGDKVYVKRLERSGGRFRLESYQAPTMDNVDIRWAAPVLWVRRG